MEKINQKFINSKQAIRVCKKFGQEVTQEHILKNFKNGDLLFRRKNTETGKITDYFLNEIYFKYFDLNYHAKPGKHYIGKEMFISSFELPKLKI